MRSVRFLSFSIWCLESDRISVLTSIFYFNILHFGSWPLCLCMLTMPPVSYRLQLMRSNVSP